MNKVALVLTGILIVFGISGCSQDTSGKRAEKPVIRGQITSITESQDKKNVVMLVEGIKEQDTDYDKAHVAVDAKTKIYSGSSSNQLSIADLKQGMRIEVYWDGPVAESYPVQMGANTIRILQ